MPTSIPTGVSRPRRWSSTACCIPAARGRRWAYDAATGKELWRFDPKVPGIIAKSACCDVVNRGLAAYKGKIYVGTRDGRLIAIDAKTGKQVWSTVTVDQTKPYTITGAPRVFKGKVIIGNGGSEYGVRGYVTAYDAETGKEAGRFYITPNPENKPMARLPTRSIWRKATPPGRRCVEADWRRRDA